MNLSSEFRNLLRIRVTYRTFYNHESHYQSKHGKIVFLFLDYHDREYKDVELLDFKAINTKVNTFKLNYKSIFNCNINRSTNTFEESFNTKTNCFNEGFPVCPSAQTSRK